MSLSLEQKKEIVTQRINQTERELYMSQLNEKIYLSTQADLNQLEYVRKEIKRCQDTITILNEEMSLLA